MIVLIATTLGGGDGDSDGHPKQAGHAKPRHRSGPVPKTYVVQNGDTLTSIAHETGVSVAHILRLNPGVDPQILVSGEVLQLR